jgi:hypothetical protein
MFVSKSRAVFFHHQSVSRSFQKFLASPEAGGLYYRLFVEKVHVLGSKLAALQSRIKRETADNHLFVFVCLPARELLFFIFP